MAGDSYCTAIVHDVPDDQVDAVLDALEEGGLALEYQSDVEEADGGLLLGTAYVADECYTTLAEEVGRALAENAPGATFDIHTEPAGGDGPGIVVMHAPGLGRFEASCDAGGEAQFPLFHIAKIVGELPAAATRDEIAEALDYQLGGPWVRRMAEFSPTGLAGWCPSCREGNCGDCYRGTGRGECTHACDEEAAGEG